LVALAASPALSACPEPPVFTIPTGPRPALHAAIAALDAGAARRAMKPDSIEARDGYGETPLLVALSTGAAREPAGIGTPAARKAAVAREARVKAALAKELIARGAAPGGMSAAEEPPLVRLAASDFPEPIELDLARRLLAAGAAVDARDAGGTTALILSVKRGKLSLASLLRGAGADPDIRNCRGEDGRAP
jgi:hypothetical protein